MTDIMSFFTKLMLQDRSSRARQDKGRIAEGSSRRQPGPGGGQCSPGWLLPLLQEQGHVLPGADITRCCPLRPHACSCPRSPTHWLRGHTCSSGFPEAGPFSCGTALPFPHTSPPLTAPQPEAPCMRCAAARAAPAPLPPRRVPALPVPGRSEPRASSSPAPAPRPWGRKGVSCPPTATTLSDGKRCLPPPPGLRQRRGCPSRRDPLPKRRTTTFPPHPSRPNLPWAAALPRSIPPPLGQRRRRRHRDAAAQLRRRAAMHPRHWVAVWALLLQGCATSARTDVRNCSTDPPYLPPTATNTTARLAALRDAMRDRGVDAYIVPSTDAHMSEYIAERDARLRWLTGFSGSAGTAVVTQDKAALWTDSRYWTQAERQLDCNWELQRTTLITSIGLWILEAVSTGGNVSLDPFLFSIDTWNSYSQALHGSGRTLIPIETNLVDEAWGDQRPSAASSEIYNLTEAFTGSSWQEKVAGIRLQMEQHVQRPTAVLLSGLEETAWLFNLRGDDIPYNPVFYSYTLLTNTTISLFVEVQRLSAAAQQSLQAACPGPLCVELQDYGQARAHLRNYTQGNVTVWLGTEYTNYGLYGVIPQEKLLETSYSPVMLAKAVKNTKEQELLRAAHVRDAVAVIQYLLWLEKTVPQGQVDEFSGAQHIDSLRRAQQYNHGPSFQSISASGLNAALAHYSPANGSSRQLSKDEMYLFDTGGQYLDGTTDITRTVHWGVPTPLQKEAYTRVLMGNIDLARLVFPPNTAGRMVESFARRALWDVGLNYGHGTGHGIGNFLSVHEWPVGFQSNNVPLAPGMFTSIEPGYYRDGEFGIRIEDIALVVEAQTEHQSGDEPFLTFEVVSLVPYDRNLIDLNLLSPEQIQYLNNYYETIRARVGPELQRQQLQEEHRWLQRSTEPFAVGSTAAAGATLGTLALACLLSVLL
ncbi:xaa-Pro aminopeptidase 2 [Colius striatus]|uniref:xaa-Pro aminopeptidase 2 n=1 Tax=Colius striatus TaxID=57412 RepID=UPI002B1D26BC|nr:xaa-Pro aminopeptidase 2 [Colius striatus]